MGMYIFSIEPLAKKDRVFWESSVSRRGGKQKSISTEQPQEQMDFQMGPITMIRIIQGLPIGTLPEAAISHLAPVIGLYSEITVLPASV